MDNDRELFEKAMKIKLGDMCPSFKRYGKPAQDQYIVPDLQSAWIGYQAAFSHSKERIAELEKDAERYRWMRNNTSVMLFERQTWVTSHKLDMRIDEAMKESE